ncbi:type I-E CRISPR-associated protein Cas7/Cse4/CasC [Pseudoalteromonas luteoviolacea]|uniref:type I-E CRISPR-associated protein Cas7/Cse4/CasC n=1 Tax=Pseudoalteromonas luteoviolacea TaxID=43657 RepID=UPI001B3A73D4|nr:type I-E CRISPR-associated protein Cas7/Cse4/CasC [Pseudoalteromonas luteoviolacea]MBQ4877963.1 type I-E CRISPR-associated protein Cas7/Cse4/CasC [Pseudoalteromonas luteoviolacea]MBQ4906998.1 type I-E CRISPR-associated protein Cas7/Cse4/CasC [Pseudoalteromonas luteoviolacea]
MSFIEFHLLQNFAPSNLNRDDTNTPKSCVFGGSQRARISSQCQKYAIRKHNSFRESVIANGGDLGIRTKKLMLTISDHLVESGKSEEGSKRVCENLLSLAEIKLEQSKDKNQLKTKFLLYVGMNEIAGLKKIAIEHFDELNYENKKKINKKLTKYVEEVFGVHSKSFAADVALFGRMVANNNNSIDLDVDAACQVAHAISTNIVTPAMDFFTAVDDELQAGEQGSGMMGGVYFNSACYYRYAQINIDKLAANLGHDNEQVLGAVQGFFRALVQAVPSGKQNSFAAQNPPSYVKVNVRKDGAPWSLSNAFTQAVVIDKPDEAELEQQSAQKLEMFAKKLSSMYGESGFIFEGRSTYIDNLEEYRGKDCGTISQLEAHMLDALQGALECK